jgi:hypothetical protein
MNRLKPFAGVGVLLFAVLILAHAQWNAQEPPLNLPLVSPEALPECGTFWLYSGSGEDGAMPPWPFDPYGGVMPVYALPNLPGQFLIADTKEDYAEWQALQFSLRQAELSGGMMSLDSIEFPGEGDTNGGGGGTWEYTPIVYGSNDLWLEMVSGSVTNGTADLIIHNPEDIITNSPVWDLYATTNLSLDTPGLNATNWVWLLRTDPGQTNLTAAALSDFQCYYRLGNTNDTDGDLLTDAFEALVSHSDPGEVDSDEDGMSDYYEWVHFGTMAQGAGDDFDGDGVGNLAELNAALNPALGDTDGDGRIDEVFRVRIQWPQ